MAAVVGGEHRQPELTEPLDDMVVATCMFTQPVAEHHDASHLGFGFPHVVDYPCTANAGERRFGVFHVLCSFTCGSAACAWKYIAGYAFPRTWAGGP